MEVALGVFDLEDMQLDFAGAGRPLFIFREGELHELKPDRVTVGGVNAQARKKGLMFSSTTHSWKLKSGDVIYMFSDGYKDQLGGDDLGKTYSNKRFKQTLADIHQRPMHDQKQFL